HPAPVDGLRGRRRRSRTPARRQRLRIGHRRAAHHVGSDLARPGARQGDVRARGRRPLCPGRGRTEPPTSTDSARRVHARRVGVDTRRQGPRLPRPARPRITRRPARARGGRVGASPRPRAHERRRLRGGHRGARPRPPGRGPRSHLTAMPSLDAGTRSVASAEAWPTPPPPIEAPGRMTRLLRRMLTARGRSLEITRAGWLFIVLTFAVGFTAVNSGSNLLHLVFGAQMALIIGSGVLSEAAVARTTARRVPTATIHASTPAAVNVELANTDPRRDVLSVSVEDDDRRLGADRCDPVFAVRIPAGA